MTRTFRAREDCGTWKGWTGDEAGKRRDASARWATSPGILMWDALATLALPRPKHLQRANAMMILRLKVLGTAVLASTITPAGGTASGQPGGPVGGQEPARAVRDAGAGRPTPSRSADETARSIARL